MTAAPIKRLLEARPPITFSLHFGFDDEFLIHDPKKCWLDADDLTLYVSVAATEIPERFVNNAAINFPATVEVIDLRHVKKVTVNAVRMPGMTNI